MVRKVLAHAIALASLGAICWGLYQTIEVGSCGTSNQYVTTRPPCPSAEALYILALTFGTIILLPAILFASGGRKLLIGLTPIAVGATLIVSGSGLTGASQYVSYAFGGILAALGAVPLVWLGLRRLRRAAPDELLATGAKATGVVLRAEELGQDDDGQMRVRATFRIQPADGSSSFTGEQTRSVPLGSVPRVGDTYQVVFDPKDRANWSYTGIPTRPSPRSAPQTAPPSAGGDPLDRLQKLDELRRSGVLTDAEFAQQKAKLLDEV